jgi:hypothetical protein
MAETMQLWWHTLYKAIRSFASHGGLRSDYVCRLIRREAPVSCSRQPAIRQTDRPAGRHHPHRSTVATAEACGDLRRAELPPIKFARQHRQHGAFKRAKWVASDRRAAAAGPPLTDFGSSNDRSLRVADGNGDGRGGGTIEFFTSKADEQTAAADDARLLPVRPCDVAVEESRGLNID